MYVSKQSISKLYLYSDLHRQFYFLQQENKIKVEMIIQDLQ